MRIRFWLVVALAFSSVQTAGAQDLNAVLHAAADAMGMLRGVGEEDAISTIQYEGTGAMSGLKLTRYRAGINYDVPGMRVDFDVAQPNQAAQRQIHVVAEEFAWNETQPGIGAKPAQATFNERLLQLWMTPPGVIKAARKAGADAKVTVERGATVITTPVPGLAGTMMKATLNARKLIDRVEAATIEATYSDYKDLGGELNPSDVLYPTRIIQKVGGKTALDLTITKGNTYNPYVVFPIPDNVR